MSTDEGPSPEQVNVLRRMTGEKRLKVAGQIYWSARKLKIAGVRSQHPGWSEDEVKAEVNRIFLNAGN